MNIIYAWIEIPAAQALGLVLLHSLWVNTLLAFGLWATLKLPRAPQVRYVLACGALAAMVVWPAVVFAVLCFRPAATLRDTGNGTHKIDGTDHFADRPAEKPSNSVQSASIWQGSRAQDRVRPAERAALFSVRSWRLFRWIEPGLPWAAALWLAGAAWEFVRLLMGLACVQRLDRDQVAPASAWWQRRVTELARQMGIKRAVQLLESGRVKTPLTVGCFRPAILVPFGFFTGFPPAQIEAILSHELAHIRRHDFLVNVLQAVVDVLLFFHPAAWWVSRQVSREREYCCDELAAEFVGGRREYARVLVAVERTRIAGDYSLALSAAGGDLKSRIHRLAQPTRPVAAGVIWGFVAGLALATVAWVTLVVLRVPSARDGADGKTAATPSEIPPASAFSPLNDRTGDSNARRELAAAFDKNTGKTKAEPSSSSKAPARVPVLLSPAPVPLDSIEYATEHILREVRMPEEGPLVFSSHIEAGQDSESIWIRTPGAGNYAVYVIPLTPDLRPYLEASWKDAAGNPRSDSDYRGGRPWLAIPVAAAPENVVRLDVYGQSPRPISDRSAVHHGDYRVHFRRLGSADDFDADTLGPEATLLRLDAAGQAKVPPDDSRPIPSLDYAGDIDVFQIPTSNAGNLTITVAPDEYRHGLHVRVYTAAGELQGTASRRGGDYALVCTTKPNDLHYLAVTGNGIQATGAYTIDVRHTSASGEDEATP